MGEYAAEKAAAEQPAEPVGIRVRITVFTTDGREWESLVQELSPEKVKKWGEVLNDLKTLQHIFIPVVDALGRETSVHFHPDKIVAIRISEEVM